MRRTRALGHNRSMNVLFQNRADAGRQLAEVLEQTRVDGMVVVGLARGGVPVAAEVARRLSLPLDALAVRKVGHPRQPEYGLGGVTPSRDGVYIRSNDGLTEDQLHRAIEAALANAAALDAVLHRDRPPLDLDGRAALLVDDGLATGATMVAAVRWARHRGSVRVVVAVPVAAASSIRFLQQEADEVVCPHRPEDFGAVGYWYEDFNPVSDKDVVVLIDELTTPATTTEQKQAGF
jgi:putative phosphoribosyl transferase